MSLTWRWWWPRPLCLIASTTMMVLLPPSRVLRSGPLQREEEAFECTNPSSRWTSSIPPSFSSCFLIEALPHLPFVEYFVSVPLLSLSATFLLIAFFLSLNILNVHVQKINRNEFEGDSDDPFGILRCHDWYTEESSFLRCWCSASWRGTGLQCFLLFFFLMKNLRGILWCRKLFCRCW